MIWLNKMFCDANGVPDDARVAAFLITLTFCAAQLMGIWLGAAHSFDAQQFGIGAGAMAAGIGGLFGLRKDH